MINYSILKKYLSLFAKKTINLYLSYVEKSTNLILKGSILLTFFTVKKPFYLLYIFLSFLGTCEPFYSTQWNYYVFYFTCSVFFQSAFIVMLYNNTWSGGIILEIVGPRFAEKYLKRFKDGAYMGPFLMIFIAFFGPFLLDIITFHIDQYEQLLKIGDLEKQMNCLSSQGNVKESTRIFEEICFLAKSQSKGIITKSNIIIQSIFIK